MDGTDDLAAEGEIEDVVEGAVEDAIVGTFEAADDGIELDSIVGAAEGWPVGNHVKVPGVTSLNLGSRHTVRLSSS